MLDFDSLPAKPAEAIPVVRFRLRKMVPFDVEHAGVSYQVLSQNETECKVLAAIVPGPILAEYEAAVRAAGYEPGAVLSSSLAALEAVDAMEAVLAANLSAQPSPPPSPTARICCSIAPSTCPLTRPARRRNPAQHRRRRRLF